MLNFRRQPPAPRAEPAPRRAAAPISNAEKARALMTLLEPGGTGRATVSPERLRDWARDLVDTIERKQVPAVARSVTPGRTPAHASGVRTLFRSAPPTLLPTAPAVGMASMRRDVSVPPAANGGAREPHDGAPSPAASRTATIGHARIEVRRIIAAAVDPEAIDGEHPAVIAMTLQGRPSREQATTLGRLPGRQARAVHAALRRMEAAGA